MHNAHAATWLRAARLQRERHSRRSEQLPLDGLGRRELRSDPPPPEFYDMLRRLGADTRDR